MGYRLNKVKTAAQHYPQFVEILMHSPNHNYEVLKSLQGALDLKRTITTTYFKKTGEEYAYPDYFEIGCGRREARLTREKLIEDITAIIKSGKDDYGDDLYPDQYIRLFHALAILKVEKNTYHFAGTTKNKVFNAMYVLWGIDDGSDEAYKILERSAWFIAEELKELHGEVSSSFNIGKKCILG